MEKYGQKTRTSFQVLENNIIRFAKDINGIIPVRKYPGYDKYSQLINQDINGTIPVGTVTDNSIWMSEEMDEPDSDGYGGSWW
jgi:hypothetical protein